MLRATQTSEKTRKKSRCQLIMDICKLSARRMLCGFADLVAPAVLQHPQHNHHDHGENDDDRRELALFDRQFHIRGYPLPVTLNFD